MVTTTDTADILETLETGTNAIREPDSTRGPPNKAWQWANTRKSYWHTANSWILATTLTNPYLESLGFPNVAKRYEMLHATR